MAFQGITTAIVLYINEQGLTAKILILVFFVTLGSVNGTSGKKDVIVM